MIKEVNEDSGWLTNDITTVISNKGLAVYIDELCDKGAGELGMCSQATNCDVLSPPVLHWQGNNGSKTDTR